MKQITQEYLDGIREGRSLLRQMQAEGSVRVEDLQRLYENARDLAPQGDVYRGERDFWKGQLGPA